MTIPYGTAPFAGTPNQQQPQQQPMQYAQAPQPAYPQLSQQQPPAGAQQGQTYGIPPQGQPQQPQWPQATQPQDFGQQRPQQLQQPQSFGDIRLDNAGRFADPRYPELLGRMPSEAMQYFQTMRTALSNAARAGTLAQPQTQPQQQYGQRPASAPPQPQQQPNPYAQDPRAQGIQDYVRQAVEPMMQPMQEFVQEQRMQQVLGQMRARYGQRFGQHEPAIVQRLSEVGDPNAWTQSNVEALYAYYIGQEALRGQQQAPQGPTPQYGQQTQQNPYFTPASQFFAEGPTPPVNGMPQQRTEAHPRAAEMARAFGLPGGVQEFEAWRGAYTTPEGIPVVPFEQYNWNSLRNPQFVGGQQAQQNGQGGNYGVR